MWIELGATSPPPQGRVMANQRNEQHVPSMRSARRDCGYSGAACGLLSANRGMLLLRWHVLSNVLLGSQGGPNPGGRWGAPGKASARLGQSRA